MSPRPALSSMRVREVDEELRQWGIEPAALSLTVLEKKSLLKEKRQENDPEAQSLGLSRKKKADLVSMCNDRGIRMTGNETVPQLTRRIKEFEAQRTPAVSTQVLGFGRHSELTYQQLVDQFPAYAQWCVDTAMEGQSNPLLERFAVWYEQSHSADITGPEEPEPVPGTASSVQSVQSRAVPLAVASSSTNRAAAKAKAKVQPCLRARVTRRPSPGSQQSVTSSMEATSVPETLPAPPFDESSAPSEASWTAVGEDDQSAGMPMEHQPGAESLEEMARLEARLASLRSMHQLPPTGTPPAASSGGPGNP